MSKAVHFGAGNIGRGFIGEILFENGFHIDFVDVNERIIDALQEKKAYEIEIAEEGQRHVAVSNVDGINNGKNPGYRAAGKRCMEVDIPGTDKFSAFRDSKIVFDTVFFPKPVKEEGYASVFF